MSGSSPGCRIDAHPHAAEIAGWLRQGLTATAVNNKLRDLSDDPVNYKPLPPSTLSYHRRLCLGMAALSQGRPKGDKVNSDDLIASGEGDAEIVKETRTLSLALFRHRLKTAPDKIANRDLIPVLTAILRLEGKQNTKDPLDDAMGDATEGADEESQQSPSPS